MDKKSPIIKLVGHEKPVEVFVPDDLRLEYADAFFVQRGPSGEFILSFLQNQPPIAFSQEAYDKIEAIEALCIARVVVLPDRLAGFLQAIQDQVVTTPDENSETDNREETT